MDESYALLPTPPGVEDYCRLRVAAGLSPKTVEAARVGLAATYFGVSVVQRGALVGMGRIVGDGGCFLQLVDIAVLPEHQGKGIGKRIVGELVEHLRRHAPASVYVTLFADGPAQHLYAQFGFRPSAPASVGMYLRL